MEINNFPKIDKIIIEGKIELDRNKKGFICPKCKKRIRINVFLPEARCDSCGFRVRIIEVKMINEENEQ